MSSSFSLRSSSRRPFNVFVSFRGDDVREGFLSHFLRELDRKMISAFKDTDIEKGQSLDPELRKAIQDSKIAVVLFSENYASSAWCLNELLEIVKCKNDCDQVVIPVFYRLDPSHVRKQTQKFGQIFEATCQKNTEDKKELWQKALEEVASLGGYDSKNWENEAKLIEAIMSEISKKQLNLTPTNDSEDLLGIEDHVEEMNVLLKLESKEVRMVGIWGPSGIGKTTIARFLFNLLSQHFQRSIYIDKNFILKSIGNYSRGNADNYNLKLHLQENFLSDILEEEGIKLNHLCAVRERLKDHKVLIMFDDLDDQMVLKALAGGYDWFGHGSRIIAITTDMQILRDHEIKCVYKVGVPSQKIALQMLCRSAFKQDSPPDGYMELASEVAMRLGGLPLGLRILGSSLRGKEEKHWEKILEALPKSPSEKIEKALSISYEGLETKQYKALFRHIACFFNGEEINYIKLMLANSGLDVDAGLEILVDKSLIHKRPSRNNTDIVEMHCLVQEMGKDIVRGMSDEPGKREFLIDSLDVRNVLNGSSGTGNIKGILFDLDEVDRIKIHEKAFDGMTNLHFLKFYNSSLERKKKLRWIMPDRFSDFPDNLKLLSWPGYPMTCMPSNFCPESLVELRMPNSKLLKLWEEVELLACLKDMDLSESKDLEQIPDLSEATNLETLDLHGCSSLVELPSSISNLNKLTDLNLAGCTKLKDLPNGTNGLKSLIRLILTGCSQLKVFPDISNKIQSIIADQTAFEIFPSNLRLGNLVELNMERTTCTRLWEGVQPLTSLRKIVLSGSENLKELPDLSMATNLKTINLNGCSSLVELTLSSIQNLNKLTTLEMIGCSNLETLPVGINLKSLYRLNLNGCSRLKSFPDISSNIVHLYLNQTGIEQVPLWINNFSSLEALEMWECKELKFISSRVFKLENLLEVFFSDCEQLAEVRWSEEAEGTTSTSVHSALSLISFNNCFLLNQEAFIQQSASEYLILPGEVPSYFTHQSTGGPLTIPLHHSSFSQKSFLEFKACVVVSDVVVSEGSETVNNQLCFIDVEVQCQFIDKHGNYFEPAKPRCLSLHLKYNHQIIFDCQFPLDQECDQVEITFILPNKGFIKRCGVRLLGDSSPFSATQKQNEDEESIADGDGPNENSGCEEECKDNSDDECSARAVDEEECGDNSDGEF